MATQEDIERLFALFCEAHPQDSLREMDKTSAGQGAVLRYLASVEEPVTSGQIAQALGGSTARMAVLLKKLEAKGLISRTPGENDARTTVVRLSQAGWEKVNVVQRDIYQILGTLIDELGLGRMLAFAETAKEICVICERLQMPVAQEPHEE